MQIFKLEARPLARRIVGQQPVGALNERLHGLHIFLLVGLDDAAEREQVIVD